MGELYNPFPKLPKNIRQIGERDDVVKLYVEDYVNTYLKRLYPTGGSDLRVGLLLGSVENHDGTPFIFIDGALEMEEVTAAGERVIFSEAAWKKAYQSIEETFPKRTVQGWFLCGTPGCNLSPLNYWKQHGQYFNGKNQLMYLNGGIDGEESIYITSNDGFYCLKGYSIYYERNQMMQDYMILRKDARRVESGTNDRVIRDFRQRMEGRKIEAVSRRGTIRTLGTLCSVLSVAVLAGGVVMFNNYQKMKEMESTLVSVLPSGVKGWKGYSAQDEESTIIVEEIKGNVYPTQALESQTVGETVGGAAGALGNEGQAQTGWDLGGEGISNADNNSETAAPSSSGENSSQVLEGNTLSGENAAPEESAVSGEKAVSGENTAAGEAAPLETIANGGDAANVPASAEPVNQSGGNATAILDYPVTNMKPGKTYEVKDGETLYGICFELYGGLTYLDDIRALNKISDMDKIIAGQKLVLPDITGLQ